jgi:CRISPR/Cas system endoribonuclease Cas6 (RAMP superfamily)
MATATATTTIMVATKVSTASVRRRHLLPEHARAALSLEICCYQSCARRVVYHLAICFAVADQASTRSVADQRPTQMKQRWAHWHFPRESGVFSRVPECDDSVCARTPDLRCSAPRPRASQECRFPTLRERILWGDPAEFRVVLGWVLA